MPVFRNPEIICEDFDDPPKISIPKRVEQQLSDDSQLRSRGPISRPDRLVPSASVDAFLINRAEGGLIPFCSGRRPGAGITCQPQDSPLPQIPWQGGRVNIVINLPKDFKMGIRIQLSRGGSGFRPVKVIGNWALIQKRNMFGF
ncbi:hypothetical protein CDAR_8851 [Caerostris darwini]|uniref:Uncharacterized protein n=1 Tax=Caerostris darwini TaxID=1538125 RepID=A0AAV4R365_9ARAC|nr:hypothetical protein CDAR_8851 [Caerostris darwini]